MEYRKLGNTGLIVSEIGLGCEGFLNMDDAQAKGVLAAAIAQGINCMDLYSPNPRLQRIVGEAITPVRDKFVLQAHFCTKWEDGQYCVTRDADEVRAAFEEQLKNLGTDYVAVGMFHYIDSVDVWEKLVADGLVDYAKELKAQGRIGHIGISSHNPIAALAAIASGAIDVMLFSVNPCYDLLPGSESCETLWAEASYEKPLFNLDPDRERLYETCQARGIGITVMKAFGGGDLLSAQYSPAGSALTVNQCLHYALTRPAVASIMAGVHSMEQLESVLAYETADAASRDYASAFAAFPKISWHGHCMYCGHCAPCPNGIVIADVMKYLNLAKAQGSVPETVAQHYGALFKHASDCVMCGRCESRCPFGVKVRKHMEEAVSLFGR